MDPITALGLAASVLQFLQLGGKVLSNAVEIHRSVDGTTKHNTDIEMVISEFENLNVDMKRKQSALTGVNSNSGAQSGLKDLSEKCEELSKELLDLLCKLKKSPNSGSFKSIRGVLKALTSKAQVDALKARFDEFKDLLLFKEVLDLKHQLTALEASKRFDKLDQNTLSLLAAIERGREMFVKEVEKQTVTFDVQLSVLGKRSRDHMQDVVQSEGEKIRRHIDEIDYARKKQLQDFRESYRSQASNNHTETKLMDKLLHSLSFPEMETRREDITEAYSKTFRWILKPKVRPDLPFSNFCGWLKSGSENCYWINGKAGAGKSTLMNFIWNSEETMVYLKSWANEKELVRLSFFFWKPGTKLQKSLQGLYRSLIYQLILQKPRLTPSAIESLDYNQRLSLDNSSTPQIAWSEKRLRVLFKYLLQSVIKNTNIFLFIDALDEFEDKERTESELLERIDELLIMSGVKICVSSRPLPIYNHYFASMPGLKLEELTRKDTFSYIKDRLKPKLLQELQPKPRLEEVDGFIQEIANRASGVFLWVRLVTQDVLQALPKGDSLQELEDRLLEIPTELEDLFLHMQKRLDKSHQRHAEEYFRMMLAHNAPYFSVFALATWEPLRQANSSNLLALGLDLAVKHIEFVKRTLPARTGGLLELTEHRLHDQSDCRDSCSEDSASNNGNDEDDIDYSQGTKQKKEDDNYERELTLRSDRIGFLHRSIYDWLLSGTYHNWLSDQGTQTALENLLKASILVCNWSRCPSDANHAVYVFAKLRDPYNTYPSPLDVCSLSTQTFELASILEGRFKTTKPELLDQFGQILSKHSPSDPWPSLFLRCTDARSVIRDFPGLAVYNKLWLYSNIKARQKASIDLSDYAAYLLTCIQVSEEHIDETLIDFLDQRLQDGANVNSKFQIQLYRTTDFAEFDRYLRLTDHQVMSSVDNSYSTFWTEVMLEIEHLWLRKEWNSNSALNSIVCRCLDAGADIDVMIPTLRTVPLNYRLHSDAANCFLRIFAEHPASCRLQKMFLKGFEYSNSTRVAFYTGTVDHLIGINFTESYGYHRFPFVKMPPGESSASYTSEDIEKFSPVKKTIREYLSDEYNRGKRSSVRTHVVSICKRVPCLRFEDQLPYVT